MLSDGHTLLWLGGHLLPQPTPTALDPGNPTMGLDPTAQPTACGSTGVPDPGQWPLRSAHISPRCSTLLRDHRSPWQAEPTALSVLGHMMSTKNSQGFPMAFWKDWRLPVSSGGTAASSRTGGPPGGPPTTEYAFVMGCSGGSPGAAAEAWLRGLPPRLSWLAGRSHQLLPPAPLGAVWSDSLPLPPAPAARRSFSRPRARRLLPPVLRVDPLLLLPVVKNG